MVTDLPELYNLDAGNPLVKSLEVTGFQRVGGAQASLQIYDMLLLGCFRHPGLVRHLQRRAHIGRGNFYLLLYK